MYRNAIVYAECVQTCAKYAVIAEGWTAECRVLLQRPDRQRVRRPEWSLRFKDRHGAALPPEEHQRAFQLYAQLARDGFLKLLWDRRAKEEGLTIPDGALLE